MTPDAIIPLSGGTVQDAVSGKWRSTNYHESDAFGTLGGYARMQAAAILARRYPAAKVVANTKCMDDRQPTHARVHAQELQELGVAQDRIVFEENSVSTGSEVTEAIKLAQSQGWRHVIFVSNEYHIERIRLFYEQAHSDVDADFVGAESVLIEDDSAFAQEFEAIKQTPEYQKRLVAENNGIEALKKGAYKTVEIKDKRERPV